VIVSPQILITFVLDLVERMFSVVGQVMTFKCYVILNSLLQNQ